MAQQAELEAACRAEQEAHREAEAATTEACAELAEARAGLAAREEWVAGLQAETQMLQVGDDVLLLATYGHTVGG